MYKLTIFKHSDGRSHNYYCLYNHPITGKVCSFSCKTPDEKEAKLYAAKKLPEIIRGAIEKEAQPSLRESVRGKKSITHLEPMTLRDFAETYVSQRRTKRGQPLRESSRKAILDSCHQFAYRFGCEDKEDWGKNVYLHAITLKDCKDFVFNNQPSDRTAEKHHINLRTAFDQARKDNIIEVNFFKEFPPRHPVYSDEGIEARCFTDEDFAVYFNSLPSRTYSERRFRNMMLLVHETGIRHGELRHIKQVNLDLKEEILMIRSDRTFSTKTTSSSRVIALSKNAIRAVRAQLEDNANHKSTMVQQSPYLFPNQYGKPLSQSTIHGMFGETRKLMFGDREHKPTIHGLRHAMVTRLSLHGLTDRMIYSELRGLRKSSHGCYLPISDNAQ